MAYIEREKIADMRRKLRAKFPPQAGWKFRVYGNDHHSSVYISLMKGPKALLAFENAPGEILITPTDIEVPFTYGPVNHYFIGRCYPKETADILHEINQIAHEGHWDRSDVMSDYFNCAWYINLRVGDEGVHYEHVTLPREVKFAADKAAPAGPKRIWLHPGDGSVFDVGRLDRMTDGDWLARIIVGKEYVDLTASKLAELKQKVRARLEA